MRESQPPAKPDSLQISQAEREVHIWHVSACFPSNGSSPTNREAKHPHVKINALSCCIECICTSSSRKTWLDKEWWL